MLFHPHHCFFSRKSFSFGSSNNVSITCKECLLHNGFSCLLKKLSEVCWKHSIEFIWTCHAGENCLAPNFAFLCRFNFKATSCHAIYLDLQIILHIVHLSLSFTILSCQIIPLLFCNAFAINTYLRLQSWTQALRRVMQVKVG